MGVLEDLEVEIDQMEISIMKDVNDINEVLEEILRRLDNLEVELDLQRRL